MTPEKAHEIARYHLGDRLYSVGRTGPHANEWTVQAVPMSGHMVHATAPTPDEAARAAADQLRAAGWRPTHARLEWERDGDGFDLVLRVDKYERTVLCGEIFADGTGWATLENYDHTESDCLALHPTPTAEVLAAVTAWHAAHLPSLHLPPFPGSSDAS